ncbi:MAG: DUF1822 family protein [Cyanobacteriota bacterium]|nr:DUF1822 family protein [Cyanobacteriota bacterium]
MMTYAIEPERFTVNLSLSAHDRAKRFRDRHTNPHKGKQVYLNTLAVYAVSFYLNCQGYEIENDRDDSTNPVMQVLMDVADVTVKNYGKIECRPVLPGAATCDIPLETHEDRIAYVAVYLDFSLTEATLLGFTRQASSPSIGLDALEPLENLPPYLHEHQTHLHSESTPSTSSENEAGDRAMVLGQWFEKIWEAGWQPLEALLPSDSQALAFGLRGTREREDSLKIGKILNLSPQGEASDQPQSEVTLLLAVAPVEDDRLGIRAQLHPGIGQTYLPHDAVLALLSKTGEILREVPARALDNFIQLPRFKCRWGERFSLRVTLGEASACEDFQLRSP